MTLTFVMMSVVAFAQQTEQKALPSLKKQPTLKQQILQAKREGKQLNKDTIAQFKYNKPAASQIIKKQQRNLTLPVKKLDVAAATAQQALRRSGGGYPKTYNFDDSSMQEWTTIDADGDGYTWVLGSQTGGIYLVDGASLAGTGHNSSEDFVTSASYSNVVGALTPDNYLVSPKVKLTGSFTFYACGQDANYAAEVFGVAVSTTGNTDAADFTMVQSWTMTAAPSLAPAPFAKANQFRSSRRALPQGSVPPAFWNSSLLLCGRPCRRPPYKDRAVPRPVRHCRIQCPGSDSGQVLCPSVLLLSFRYSKSGVFRHPFLHFSTVSPGDTLCGSSA